MQKSSDLEASVLAFIKKHPEGVTKRELFEEFSNLSIYLPKIIVDLKLKGLVSKEWGRVTEEGVPLFTYTLRAR